MDKACKNGTKILLVVKTHGNAIIFNLKILQYFLSTAITIQDRNGRFPNFQDSRLTGCIHVTSILNIWQSKAITCH